jgi:hypothetical protein
MLQENVRGGIYQVPSLMYQIGCHTVINIAGECSVMWSRSKAASEVWASTAKGNKGGHGGLYPGTKAKWGENKYSHQLRFCGENSVEGGCTVQAKSDHSFSPPCRTF